MSDRVPDTHAAKAADVRESRCEEVLSGWLTRQMNLALAEKDLGGAVRAMRDAATLQGMSEVSRATGLNRVNLYRMLAEDGNPKLNTVLAILEVYGLRLMVRRKGQ